MAAIAAGVALAQTLGLPVSEPAVISVRSNEIVRLSPGLVARASGLVDEVRDARVYFEREVAIARCRRCARCSTKRPR